MCTCIAEIKTSYTKVRKQAEEVASQSFDMDDFLDAINVVKKELARVTDETNALVELVRDHFTEITVDEAKELLDLSEPIQKKMQVVYLKLLASPLNVGLETATDHYRQAMSDFDELCHDMKTFNIDLAQDDHFQQTLKKVSEMMRGRPSVKCLAFSGRIIKLNDYLLELAAYKKPGYKMVNGKRVCNN